jgi:hypothetical protein
MIRIYTDFNARTTEGECFLLFVGEKKLADCVGDLNLHVGDLVVLYQDDGDFEVEAELKYQRVELLNKDDWIAAPNWSTLVRK